ncbi:MAG: hypothetical protein AB8B69_06225 [Chitinophagales bacterium]
MNCKHFFFSTFLYLLLFSFNCQNIQAQVEDIKEASDRNSDAGSDDSGFSADSGTEFFFDIAFDFLTLGYGYHAHQLSREKEIQEMSSIEVQPMIGYANGNTIVVAPRIRGNWGLFSTDFRYFNLVGGGLYQTLDWQFMLNVVNEKEATFRIGTGVMHEYYSEGRTYTEHFFGLDTRWGESKNFTSNIEFRLAKDYNTGATPRLELNLKLNRKIYEKGRIVGYWSVGGIYQRYFNQVNVWTGQTGLSFMLK